MTSPGPLVRWDGWTLDVAARRLSGPEGPVHLEPQVFDVLAYLLEHRARVVPKEELLDEVWGDQFVSESALTSRIKSVRRALGDDGRAQRYVRNVRGRGYQFTGEVVGAEAADGARPDPPGAVPADLGPSIALDDEFPFVGRVAEVEEIGLVLTRRRPPLVLIGGAPGVGKSRLAVEAIETAGARLPATTCAGRCGEHATSTLEPVRDAVAQLAASCPSEFRGWAAGFEQELVSLAPALADLLGAAPRTVDGYSALEVLLAVVVRATEVTPLTILIDDLHWSDEPTRAFLARLLRRVGERPTTVVCTFRTAAPDVPDPVRAWIKEQARRHRAVRVELEDLDADAGRRLIAQVMGDDCSPDEVADLMARTGGHGLFLTESLRDRQGGDAGRSSVTEIVGARLARLGRDAQSLVRAGAALGPEFPFDLAVEVAGIDAVAGLEAVDEATAARVLHDTASPSRVRFSHQLVPEAVLAAMSRPARAVVHHRAAEALTARGADPVQVAHHLLEASPLVDPSEVVARCRAAATAATAANRFDPAIRLLDRVLATELAPRTRAEVLLQVGWALVDAGRAPEGAERFEEAAARAREDRWDDVLVDAALGHCGRSPYRRLLDSSTLDLLAEADGLLGEVRSLEKARVLAKTAVFSQFTLPLATCDEMTRRAMDMVPEASRRDRLELLQSRAIVFTCPAGASELARLDQELAALQAPDDPYFADAAVPETVPLMQGDGDGLRARARADATRLSRQPIAEWRDLTLRSTLSAFAGDLGAAAVLCDEAGSIGPRFWGDSAPVLHALGHVFVAALGGGWGRVIDLFDVLLDFDQNQQLILPATWANLAGGRPARGRELAEGIRTETFRWHGEHILGGNTLVAAAEVALLLDDDGLAAAAEEHLRPFQDLMLGLPWACSLAAADPLARLAERRGDHREAAGHRARAARIYRGLEAPALSARLG